MLLLDLKRALRKMTPDNSTHCRLLPAMAQLESFKTSKEVLELQLQEER